jgi:hypothetical protein
MTTRQLKAAMLVLALVAPAGCTTGPKARDYRVLREARGAEIMVEGPKAKLTGELLEVRDEHLVIWDGCRVLLAPFVLIRDSGFRTVEPKWIAGVPTAAARTELRLLSRYPTGMPAGVLSELLKCSGATALAVAEL